VAIKLITKSDIESSDLAWPQAAFEELIHGARTAQDMSAVQQHDYGDGPRDHRLDNVRRKLISSELRLKDAKRSSRAWMYEA
jgi:hypothetical protein